MKYKEELKKREFQVVVTHPKGGVVGYLDMCG